MDIDKTSLFWVMALKIVTLKSIPGKEGERRETIYSSRGREASDKLWLLN